MSSLSCGTDLRGDQRGYLHALLGDGDGDGDNDRAWHAATAAPPDTRDADLWLALGERREATDPADAVAVYLRIADNVLITTDRPAYSRAARILKRAQSAAQAAGELDAFAATRGAGAELVRSTRWCG